MSAIIDLNDVPHVSANDLMRVMQRLIASENGLIFLTGLNAQTRGALEDAIWAVFEDQPETRLAVLVRFESLISLFASRRLKDQFTAHGLALLAPAFAIAARQRLNTNWGFNPQKFLMSLQAKLTLAQTSAADTPRVPATPIPALQTEPQLAA